MTKNVDVIRYVNVDENLHRCLGCVPRPHPWVERPPSSEEALRVPTMGLTVSAVRAAVGALACLLGRGLGHLHVETTLGDIATRN